MIDPDLDIGPDLDALARGDFVRDGEDLVVGNRRYGHHPDTGSVYPKSGPGIVQMDRAQYKLLKQLNDYPVDKALAWAKQVPGLDDHKIRHTLELWKKCRK